MERVRSASADVLAYRAGNWLDGLAAILLGVFGLLLIILALGISRDHAMFVGVLGLTGIGLTLAGAVAFLRSLGRFGVILDRAKGTVVTWRGVVIGLSKKRRDLAAFDTILLSPARVRQRHAAGIVYVVGLQGPQGEPLACYHDATYQTARRFGVELAAFLGLTFTDASGTEAIVRTLGQPSLALRHLQPPETSAMPPPALKCRAAWNGPALVIEEPSVPRMRSIGVPVLLFLLAALPCLGYGAYLQFFEALPAAGTSPLVASIVVVVLLFLIFVGVVLASTPHLYQRQLVQADSNSLRFTTARAFATKGTSLRSQEITELRVAFGHLIVVTPRELRVVCGRLDQPLPRAELEWLRQQMWRALKAP
jgi:hypothetical protein